MKDSIDLVLDELGFDQNGKNVFIKSINLVKAESNDENINANIEIMKLIKEYINNEVLED